MKTAALILLVCLGLPAAPVSGGKIRFDRISIREGLSLSSVNCLTQDAYGFMWFGTEDGLNRYDGVRFRIFKNDPENPRSLSGKWIEHLFADRRGRLWVVVRGRLNCYHPETESFTSFPHRPDDPHSLSSDTVRVIAEDRSGAIWVGGDGGLNRFDEGSQSFTRFRHHPAQEASLASDIVRCLHVDRRGCLWIGTAGGLNCFDGRVWKRFRHRSGDAASLSADDIRAVGEDAEGRLWIGSEAGLDLLDPRDASIRHPLPGGPTGVDSLLLDRSGRLWVSTRLGVDRVDPKRLTSEKMLSDRTVAHSMAALLQTRPLLVDSSGPVWIGTSGDGVYACAAGESLLRHYRSDPSDPSSLSADTVYAMAEDRSGSIWFGTFGSGLSKHSPRKYKFAALQRNPYDEASLSSNFVWSVFEDRAGMVWIGTEADGLNRFDPERGTVTRYRRRPGDAASMTGRPIRAILEDAAGVLWLGTTGDGLIRFDRRSGGCVYYRHDPADPASISSDSVKSLYEDTAGNLWLGTHAGLNRFDRNRKRFTAFRHDPSDPHSLSADLVYANILENSDGTLWIGTYGGGLNRFDPRNGRAERFRNDPSRPDSLSEDNVLAIRRDRNGSLWVGTHGGLNRLDDETGRFRHWHESDGLANEVIYGVIDDSGGDLWMSSNKGLLRLSPASGAVRRYDMADGLQSDEFNGGAWHAGRSGRLYFGGVYGVNFFRPEQVADNPYRAPVRITDFLIDNRPVPVGGALGAGERLAGSITCAERIRISYKQAFFSFEFAALDFTAPEKNRYAFMLEGRDPGWIDMGGRNYATFIRLAPGRYRLRIRGSNSDGVWSEMAGGLGIEVVGPFWRSWWFRSLLAGLALMGVLLLNRWRVKRMVLERELQAAHDAQMSIMPQRDPRPGGLDVSGICLPASEVGGDFFDYLWFHGDPAAHFGIVIGDVSGKAMKAAMTAVLTSGMFLVKTHQATPLPEMMEAINQSLCAKTEKNIFTAICLASFDLQGRRLQICNAGLCKPLRWRRGEIAVIESEGDQVPLGILPDQRYSFKAVPLEPGDIIILFSDGVTDACNDEGEFFGNERLQAVFASSCARAADALAIKNSIIAAVRGFAGSARQFDDMTLVVARVE